MVYRRPLQTNEPIKDRPIPEQGEVNVIAAIGPLNNRKEANAHGLGEKTTGNQSMFIRSLKGCVSLTIYTYLFVFLNSN